MQDPKMLRNMNIKLFSAQESGRFYARTFVEMYRVLSLCAVQIFEMRPREKPYLVLVCFKQLLSAVTISLSGIGLQFPALERPACRVTASHTQPIGFAAGPKNRAAPGKRKWYFNTSQFFPNHLSIGLYVLLVFLLIIITSLEEFHDRACDQNYSLTSACVGWAKPEPRPPRCTNIRLHHNNKGSLHLKNKFVNSTW